MYAMRNWGLAQTWRSMTMQKRSPSAPLNSLVALGLLLMDIAMQHEAGGNLVHSFQWPLSREAPRYAVHTVVDQCVRAAKLLSKAPFAPKLVNAVLRRFQREREQFVESVKANDVARWGYPAWWVQLVRRTYPDSWQSILEASKLAPSLVIRVNRRRASVQQVLQAMQDHGVVAKHVSDDAVVLESAGAVERLPGYEEGWWSVQDLSAQRAAMLLAPFDGARVLDACCAPGGKAAHLLELADIDLTAVDQDARRLDMVRQNLDRLGLYSEGKVRLVHTDIRLSKAWEVGAPYDLILADVPCTASGVVRRHPDIAWLRRESDLAQTVALQRAILDALWPSLAPGGRLLLATCSVFAQEGELQAEGFLQRHPDAIHLPSPGQILPCAAGEGHCGHDGFFYALFEKRVVHERNMGS